MPELSSNPLRVAQIGVGYWGTNLLRTLRAMPDVDLVLACDENADALRRASSSYRDLIVSDSADQIWDSSHIEAVVIATGTSRHFDLAQKALQHGKHVFVEKPLTSTVEEADTLIGLADDGNLCLMVGHLLLYHSAFRYVKRLIERGELGDIRYMYSSRVNLGIVRQHENAFDSLAPHDLSVALAFVDSKPVSVTAHGHAYVQPGIEDVVFATVFFENGALAHIHASWLDPHKVRKTTIVGSAKMSVIDDMQPAEKVRIFDKGVQIAESSEESVGYADFARSISIRSGDITIPKISLEEPLRVECREFVDSIREQRKPLTDGRAGRDVVHILEAVRKSIRQNGASVDL